MSKISSGYGPTKLLLRYTKNVAINAPKNITSEPRNDHMSNFLLLRPVDVLTTSPCSVFNSYVAVAANFI